MAVTSPATSAVAFKGRMMTLSVLEIRAAELDRVEDSLTTQLERSPGFFQSMPVLLSLGKQYPELGALVVMLREQGLVPMAVLNADERQQHAAVNAGLGVLSDNRQAQTRPDKQRQSQSEDKPKSRLVTRPVRSGQQIYARGTDLVVTTSVSEGAEVIADGHIHVYGALRGRALAGASGDAQARIFCRKFGAELVAIAGNYRVADDMQDGLIGQAIQVRMQGDSLVMEAQQQDSRSS